MKPDVQQCADLGQKIIKNGMPAGMQVSGTDLLNFIAPMIDGMLKEVPLEKFEEMKRKNPKAPVVPVMEENQIKHSETKNFLKLIDFFATGLPVKMLKPTYKLAMCEAYKIDNSDEYRLKWTKLEDMIVSSRIKEKTEELSANVANP